VRGPATSAKLACLAADGLLQEGEHWIQEQHPRHALSGRFAWDDRADGIITPSITGCAFVTGDHSSVWNEKGPLCWGIR
jgi:4-hydroxyproline epimerase